MQSNFGVFLNYLYNLTSDSYLKDNFCVFGKIVDKKTLLEVEKELQAKCILNIILVYK